MTILDGRKIANNILESLKAEIAKLQFQPLFCDVLVGNDPVSLSYVKIKGRTAESIGLKFLLEQLPEDILQEELIKKVVYLNAQKNLCGLIVQLPLPAHISRADVLDVISPNLDVDCLGTKNSQNFYDGKVSLMPPTAAAVMSLVDELPDNLKGGKFVMVGQGQLVGKPVSHILRQKKYEVTVADKFTTNLSELCRTADVLISATGRANLITKDFIKSGAAIIDAGTAEMDGGIVGDVDFESVKDIAGYITPVPGGVGPITVAMLLKNVVEVAKSLK